MVQPCLVLGFSLGYEKVEIFENFHAGPGKFFTEASDLLIKSKGTVPICGLQDRVKKIRGLPEEFSGKIAEVRRGRGPFSRGIRKFCEISIRSLKAVGKIIA